MTELIATASEIPSTFLRNTATTDFASDVLKDATASHIFVCQEPLVDLTAIEKA